MIFIVLGLAGAGYLGYELGRRQRPEEVKGPAVNITVDWDLIRNALDGSGYRLIAKNEVDRVEVRH